MPWRTIHRWLGLVAGSFALLLGLTGVLLATDPVRDSWQAEPAASDLSVATLAQRASRTVAGIEEIRRLPSGEIVVYSFDGGVAQAARIDPRDGRVLSAYQPSAFARWVKNLHRSFLLGNTGRAAAGGVALAMLVLCASGLVLTAQRLGGWRQLGARVRGSALQRVHVATGRVAVTVLLLSSVTALYMSAATFGFIATDSGQEPDVVSTPAGQPGQQAQDVAALRELRVQDLRKLSFPSADDAQDTWKADTRQGVAWIDQYSGAQLAWQDATPAQRIQDVVMLLHTGEGAWPWALLLMLAAASIPVFWASGVLLWWQGRQGSIRIDGNIALAQADTLVFVASEGGTTWGFARTLQQALRANGRRVHVGALEDFRVSEATRHLFVLAATYGDGQPPARARQAVARIASQQACAAPVAVLGFGDRQFEGYCAYAETLADTLAERGWTALLPLERIHQQSAQEFERWGTAVGQALGEPLVLRHVPRVPATHTLTLRQREDFPGAAGTPAAILRFAWTEASWVDRLRGRALPRFDAGDLVGILPEGASVPRYYSLASGRRDGFLEICVRQVPGGACSGQLHAMQPGDTVQGFIKRNPDFVLDATRRPVLLIGAGTGVAPLAGFIRGNRHRGPMHLYFGSRDPAKDFYFGRQLQRWLDDRRLGSLRTAFSRIAGGGGHVQDLLRRDEHQVRALVARGAVVRVCGSRPMASGVAQTLDDILGAMRLSVARLKQQGRYAEDVF